MRNIVAAEIAWRQCHALKAALLVIVLWLGSAGCTRQESGDGGGQNISPQASIRAAREFLRDAAAGDSARLARGARDTIVKTVLLNHRLGSAGRFRAGSETFHEPKVDMYPSAAHVRFRYEYEGQEFDAFIALELEGGQIRVTNYGVPAIID